MRKYSKGPWCIGTSYPPNVYDYNSEKVANTCHVWQGEGETKANARLIAAAPDLYETLCRMSYIFMQVVQAVEIDTEGTRFEVENKATGEKGSLSLQEVFKSASNAIDKVHGETNE